MTTKTGYKQDIKGAWISKDPNAQLIYSMDWATEWLPTGDSLSTATYTVSTITGDANPLAIESSGIQSGVTYVELSGGTAGEIYTVTCTITTQDENTDVRRFKVRVEERFL